METRNFEKFQPINQQSNVEEINPKTRYEQYVENKYLKMFGNGVVRKNEANFGNLYNAFARLSDEDYNYLDSISSQFENISILPLNDAERKFDHRQTYIDVGFDDRNTEVMSTNIKQTNYSIEYDSLLANEHTGEMVVGNASLRYVGNNGIYLFNYDGRSTLNHSHGVLMFLSNDDIEKRRIDYNKGRNVSEQIKSVDEFKSNFLSGLNYFSSYSNSGFYPEMLKGRVGYSTNECLFDEKKMSFLHQKGIISGGADGFSPTIKDMCELARNPECEYILNDMLNLELSRQR